MLSDRTKMQLALFEKALDTLYRALAMNETSEIRDSVIKRFEYTFEMAWRAMDRVLTDMGEAPTQLVGAVLQLAFKAKLIEDADLWQKIRDCRNSTSHAYNEKVAIEVAAYVRSTAVSEFGASLRS